MVHMIGRGQLFTRFANFRAKSACNDSTKAIFGKGIQWRRMSYAASVPSDVPKAPKRYKRVPKDERRAMVESYVKMYREKHAGKFPPVGLARKEVGGSHYVIRQILQELECKSKIPAERVAIDVQTQYDLQVLARNDVKDVTSDKQVELEEESHGDILEAQNCQLERDSKGSSHQCLEMTEDGKLDNVHLRESHGDVLEAQNCVLERDTNDSSRPYPEAIEVGKMDDPRVEHSDPVPMDSDRLEKAVDDQSFENLEHSASKDQHDYSDTVAAESHLPKSNGEILSSSFPKDARDGQKEHAEIVDSTYIKSHGENDGSPQLDTDMREDTTTQTNDGEIFKRSTLWGSLKSFADGFFNIWRKR